MKIEAVLFDFDGTLLNSNRLINESHRHVLDQFFPGRFTEETVRAFNGPSLKEVYERLDPENSERLIQSYVDFNWQHHDDYVELFPNVVPSLARLKNAGKKLAVVSTKRRKTLEKGLNLFQLSDFFDVIFSGDEFTFPKPDPQSLEAAVASLKVARSSTIMVGDNWQDIEAANRANVTSVFVGWSEKSIEQVADYKPYYVPGSMVELTDWILSEK